MTVNVYHDEGTSLHSVSVRKWRAGGSRGRVGKEGRLASLFAKSTIVCSVVLFLQRVGGREKGEK